MKKLQIKRSIRICIIIFNAIILSIWSFIVFFWYIAITSDAPPAPTVSELSTLDKLVFYWLIIHGINVLFLLCTEKKSS